MKIAVVADYILDEEIRKTLRIGNSYQGSNPTGTVNLSKGLAQFPDIELHHISMLPCISNDLILQQKGVILHFLRVPPRLTAASFLQYPRLKVQRELAQIKPDIVHGHHAEAGYPYFAMNSQFKSIAGIHNYLPILFNTQNPPLISSSRIFRLFEAYTLRKYRYITVDSAFMMGLVQRNTKAQITTIPNCVNESLFDPEACIETALPTIFCAGAFRPEKGLEVLLRALGVVRSRFPDVKLNLTGNGDPIIRKKAESLIEDLNIRNNVQLMGWIGESELKGYLASCWMAVVPSLYEPFGCTVVEAMAMGKAVVGSKTGGIAENIIDGQCGLLFQPGDYEALAECICSLLGNEQMRRCLGAAASKRAARLWHPNVVAQAHRNLYRSILEE